MAKLITAAGTEAIEGITALRIANGPSLGQHWRYERLTHDRVDGEHRVHASKSGGKRGRVHREFHPHVFGATVVVDITWRRRAVQGVKRVCHKVDDALVMGALALVPLAFFEHFHGAEVIVTTLGMSGH